MAVMEKIYAEKRYEYYRFFGSQKVMAEFLWSVKKKEGMVIIKIEKKTYDIRYRYNPRNYTSSARAYLKIVKDIEQMSSIEDVVSLTYPYFLDSYLNSWFPGA